MRLVNLADAKARLSELVELAASGTEVTICRHNKPVARLMPVDVVSLSAQQPRKVGGQVGAFTVPPSFFEPLPADIEASFYPAHQADRSARVAEGK